MSRDVFKVMDEMLAVNPPAQNPFFRVDLERLRGNAIYTPPECAGDTWRALAVIVNCYMPKDRTQLNECEAKIVEIFEGRGTGREGAGNG